MILVIEERVSEVILVFVKRAVGFDLGGLGSRGMLLVDFTWGQEDGEKWVQKKERGGLGSE